MSDDYNNLCEGLCSHEAKTKLLTALESDGLLTENTIIEVLAPGRIVTLEHREDRYRIHTDFDDITLEVTNG